jgi:hypothetical protein
MAKRDQQTAALDHAQLDSRLNDYSAVVRISVVASALNGRVGRWPIYAAAAGSALAMATSASASIIYHGPSNNYGNAFTTPRIPTPTLRASTHTTGRVVLGSGHNLGLIALAGKSFGSVGLDSGGSSKNRVNIFVSATNNLFAKEFGLSSLIGPAAGKLKVGFGLVRGSTSGGGFGNFPLNDTGFAGLAITSSGPSHLVTEYGWIRLEAVSLNGFPEELKAIDWAFDTSGNAIAAGEVVAPTPEPGTMALALLAAGAAGVAALRRRRARLQA